MTLTATDPTADNAAQPDAARLAAFALNLKHDDIPSEVRERARQMLTDSVAVSLFGSRLPWSRSLRAQAEATSASGAAEVIGDTGAQLEPGAAALVNAAAAHAFEMDCLRKPGAGTHPGAILTAAGLAAAQAENRSGAELIDAVVAGGEIMGRLGLALRRTSEEIGFHAPGITGVFGAAATAGRLLGLDQGQLSNAFGIAGSLCGGLMAFSAGEGGGMVKRLHLGRAAQNGVFAAQLAARNYEGPPNVFEGHHGVLHVYANNADANELTAEFGQRWEAQYLCMKSFPCHITAHGPIYALRALREQYDLTLADIAHITVRASQAVLDKHNVRTPPDLGSAQYSVPYCLAVDLHRNLEDPARFDETVLGDKAIAATVASIEVSVLPKTSEPGQAWTAEVSVRGHDGETLSVLLDDFPGSPTSPFDAQALRNKFRNVTQLANADALFDALMHIEQRAGVRGLIGEFVS
jgi:2-methylcitrate dehydratase PrpD